MKKTIFYLLILFSLQTGFAQDSINQPENIGKKNNNSREIATILKNIRQELHENYTQENVNYFVKQFSVRDNKDTLVDIKNFKKLNLKLLTQRNLKLMLLSNYQDPFHVDVSPYFAYEPTVTEDHWLALSIYYDSMKVIDFDFFYPTKNYNYEIIRADENTTTVKFHAHRFYEGYFTFNTKNFHLTRVAFKNTEPYFIYNRFESDFISRWKYNRVTVKLDFRDNAQGKLFLYNLDAMQELTNFRSKRLGSSGRVVERHDNLHFYSTLNMKQVE